MQDREYVSGHIWIVRLLKGQMGTASKFTLLNNKASSSKKEGKTSWCWMFEEECKHKFVTLVNEKVIVLEELSRPTG